MPTPPTVYVDTWLTYDDPPTWWRPARRRPCRAVLAQRLASLAALVARRWRKLHHVPRRTLARHGTAALVSSWCSMQTFVQTFRRASLADVHLQAAVTAHP